MHGIRGAWKPDRRRASTGCAAFYERHPYPPPVDSLENYRRSGRTGSGAARTIICPGPRSPYREDHSILIAGCGTSQAAKHALRWPAARVTGIDFSATSVRSHRGAQAQIRPRQPRGPPASRSSASASWGRRFDQIVCTGVLHHLADPDAGLAALRDVLRAGRRDAPHGVRAVRTDRHLHAAGVLQAARHRAPPTTGSAISSPRSGRCRPDIRWRRCCARRRTSGSAAALADALLHPQDRAYSVPQLFELLEEAGLTFGRWVRQAPYSPHCGVDGAHPASVAARRSFRRAEQYAAVELFRGTMVRHSVIVVPRRRREATRRRSASPATPGSATCRFACPTRSACEERLPAGRGGGADQPEPHLHGHLLCRSTRRRSGCSTPSTASARSATIARTGEAARRRARPVRAALLVRPGRLRRVRARAPLRAALRRRRDSNPRRFRATVFKTVAFDRSATPPGTTSVLSRAPPRVDRSATERRWRTQSRSPAHE